MGKSSKICWRRLYYSAHLLRSRSFFKSFTNVCSNSLSKWLAMLGDEIQRRIDLEPDTTGAVFTALLAL